MTFETKKLNLHFAAEITGFDASAQMIPKMRAFIENSMAEHAVLVLPDQALTDEQHIDFAS